jgi:histidine ammonia-lyase
MIDNVAHILAIEWLAAAQGIEFLRPLASSAALEDAHQLLRGVCPAMPRDRYMAPDIANAAALVARGALGAMLRGLPGVPPLWRVSMAPAP